MTMASWLRTSLLKHKRTVLNILESTTGLPILSAVKPTAVPVRQSPCLSTNTTATVCGYNLTQIRAYRSPREFVAPSPFKNPGPNRLGYQQKIYDGGPLPRIDKPIKSQSSFVAKDTWNRKRALFGQNDYIDILGDGTLHPAELINGPRFIKAFNGNELQRLVRMMAVNGWRIKHLYPKRYHEIYKRIRFLYKKYNHRRGKKH